MHTKTIFELLLETGKAITSEVDLETVVQRVTDIGTELVGAQFGAFFYNVINHSGESFVLYTISGVPKEAFSKFPMPRNTKIFAPTFLAQGTVRYDDVTQQPHYGQNPPYNGMPKGHLSVRSYLAVPVVSPVTKEAIGGLFFGHSDVGVFTEDSERLIEGVALQAAIAMTNARLFEEKKGIEKKLQEQKEQYQSIFNATSDSLIIYDENGFIVEANPSACQIYGYSYEELIGTNAHKFFKCPKDFNTLKEIAFSGREYSGVHTRIKKDGSHIEVEFRGTQFIYRGKPHVLSASRDVSSTKKTEEALEQSEAFTQTITNASPAALWMTNSEGGNIFLNQTWLDWVGGGLKEQLDAGWLNAVIEEDRDSVREAFLSAFDTRKNFAADFRIKKRNGEIRWCSSHGTPYINKEGKFAGYAGSVTDITERKVAEQKLESQSVLLQTITNNTQQALLLQDERQVCTYMNPAAEKMTGYRISELQDKPLHYYVHHTHPDGRHFPIEECPIGRSLITKSNTQGEEVFIHKDGHFYPIAFSASPILENGRHIGTVIEARDITEEKRLQEELHTKERQAMQLLEEKVRERTLELEKSNYELMQFASVASHDLKEPVRKISIFSRMLHDLLQENLNPTSERYLNSIINSSARMARLIDDLLSFSRLSHGGVQLEAVDLNHLLHQIIEDLEIPIREKGASIHVDTLPTIEGIPLQLGQVFQNLISNSLKFSLTERAPEIHIRAERSHVEGKKGYWISYRDNGIGFKQEQAERIFDIFHRLHTRDKYEGTGVGLAIVKKIIELHKGTIKATGYENAGALFEIFLPDHP